MLGSLFLLPRLRFTFNLGHMLRGDESRVAEVREFYATFPPVDLRADLRDPEIFALVERMQEDLRGFPGISGSRSYVDAIRMALAPDVIETADGPTLGVQALASGGVFPEQLLNRDLNRACIYSKRPARFPRDRGAEAI